MSEGLTLDQIGTVARGKSRHRPRNEPALYGGPYPFVQTGDIKASPFYITSHEQTYSELGLAQSKLWPKDTLCITIAANIGESAVLRYPACFPDSVIGFTANPKKSDVRFVKYLLDSFKGHFQAISRGTTQDNLSVEKLTSVELPCPPLPVQRKIAGVLSAYDDLIENNRRRIAILENMAEEIYREWFVRMRFPGHQNAKFEKGVPVGWDLALGSKFFTVVKGKSYTSDEIVECSNGKPFVNLKNFLRNGGFRKDGTKFYSGRFRDEQTVITDDVVMAVTDMTQDRAVVGRAARIPDGLGGPAVISLDVVKLVPHDISRIFLYSNLRFSGFGDFIKQFANGANVLHLSPQLLSVQNFLIPTRELQAAYLNIAEPLLRQADTLHEIINRSINMRDALLPRLISGKLSVDELDIHLPPSMSEDAEQAIEEHVHA
jgi:type I restriction enzyme S subunit